MIYTLPEAFFGSTHIKFFDISTTPGAEVRCSGRYGSGTGDDFVAEPVLKQVHRLIGGRECIAFLAAAVAAGAPQDDFRAGDLTDWFTAWGHDGDGEAWYAENPAPEEGV